MEHVDPASGNNDPIRSDDRTEKDVSPDSPQRPDFRPWEAMIALGVLATIYAVISSQLRLGPVWLLPIIVIGLLLAVVTAHKFEQSETARRLLFVITGAATAAVGGSILALLDRLLRGDVLAPSLLRDAALLWFANIIVFGLWYWELDGGGPYLRHIEGYQPTDLAFPQTTLGKLYSDGWKPQFVDYLFVAFTASAAFSPTDTMFLSVRSKLLMMVQATGSIVVLAVVAARAINILH